MIFQRQIADGINRKHVSIIALHEMHGVVVHIERRPRMVIGRIEKDEAWYVVIFRIDLLFVHIIPQHFVARLAVGQQQVFGRCKPDEMVKRLGLFAVQWNLAFELSAQTVVSINTRVRDKKS